MIFICFFYALFSYLVLTRRPYNDEKFILLNKIESKALKTKALTAWIGSLLLSFEYLRHDEQEYSVIFVILSLAIMLVNINLLVFWIYYYWLTSGKEKMHLILDKIHGFTLFHTKQKTHSFKKDLDQTPHIYLTSKIDQDRFKLEQNKDFEPLNTNNPAITNNDPLKESKDSESNFSFFDMDHNNEVNPDLPIAIKQKEYQGSRKFKDEKESDKHDMSSSSFKKVTMFSKHLEMITRIDEYSEKQFVLWKSATSTKFRNANKKLNLEDPKNVFLEINIVLSCENSKINEIRPFFNERTGIV